jgi:hypothetical protein
VTSQPRAFLTLDLGSATTSAALVGHVGGRWRLIAHTSAPACLDVDGVLVGLLSRVELTDPELLAELAGVERPTVSTLVATWPRLEARTTPPRRIAVLAGSRRQRRHLEEVALRAGWLVSGGSADEMDLVALSRVVLSTQTAAVLLGADHSPAGDERRHLPDLAALAAAAKRLRPELTVILAGGAAAFESTFAGATDVGPAYVLATDQESRLASVVPEAAVRAPEVADPVEAAPLQASAPPEGADSGFDSSAWVADVPAPDDKVEGQSKASPEAPPAADVAAPPVPAAVRDSAASTIDANRGVSPQILLAPDAGAGEPAGASLQQVLEGLRALPNDSRLGVARSIGSLAYVLDRVVEVVEIGLQGGLRARSEPIGGGHSAVVSSHACFANASFSPADPSEEVIDSVFAWSTTALDRHRLTDRLHDLRLVPWGDADGDGAVFRLAAAKAAFSRLVDVTTELTASPMPALTVAAGGIFASLPPSVVALAMADLGRRPGIGQLVCDQARMLGPLGAVEDEAERRRLLANLADDILVPLGCLVLPAGVKSGRTAGQLRLQGTGAISEIELHPGAIQVVDLPPGLTARAEFDFRDSVRLGTRGHHFSVEVSGGLCGLLVDLRDIPLRMSDRAESRRAALDAWQRGMWPGVDE